MAKVDPYGVMPTAVAVTVTIPMALYEKLEREAKDVGYRLHEYILFQLTKRKKQEVGNGREA